MKEFIKRYRQGALTADSATEILRNKVFQWLPITRNFVYPFYTLTDDPLFILGNQKSGTSAIASLLGEATQKSTTVDIGGWRSRTYELIRDGQLTLKQAIRYSAKVEFSRPIIKEPNLTFLYHELVEVFPHAKFVLVVRNPLSNIRSLLNRLNVPGDLTTLNCREYPEIHELWEYILFHQLDHGQAQGDYIGRQIARWNDAAQLADRCGGEVPTITYEEFKANKLNTIYSLAKDLNLPVLSDITSKVDIQYQVKGKPTNLPEFFGSNYSRILTETASLRACLKYD